MYEHDSALKSAAYIGAQKQAAQFGSLGNANQTAGMNAARPPLMSEDVIQRIAGRLSGLQNLDGRLSGITARLCGCGPAGVGSASDASPPDSLHRKLSMIEDALSGIEISIRDSVERLEQFV